MSSGVRVAAVVIIRPVALAGLLLAGCTVAPTGPPINVPDVGGMWAGTWGGTAVALLRAGTARARVRRRRGPAPVLGRAGKRVHLARERARHLRGWEGQRLGRRQRPQGRPDPQVHPGWQVPHEDRRARCRR